MRVERLLRVHVRMKVGSTCGAPHAWDRVNVRERLGSTWCSHGCSTSWCGSSDPRGGWRYDASAACWRGRAPLRSSSGESDGEGRAGGAAAPAGAPAGAPESSQSSSSSRISRSYLVRVRVGWG